MCVSEHSCSRVSYLDHLDPADSPHTIFFLTKRVRSFRLSEALHSLQWRELEGRNCCRKDRNCPSCHPSWWQHWWTCLLLSLSFQRAKGQDEECTQHLLCDRQHAPTSPRWALVSHKSSVLIGMQCCPPASRTEGRGSRQSTVPATMAFILPFPSWRLIPQLWEPAHSRYSVLNGYFLLNEFHLLFLEGRTSLWCGIILLHFYALWKAVPVQSASHSYHSKWEPFFMVVLAWGTHIKDEAPLVRFVNL